MQFGFSLLMRGPDARPDAFLQMARRAEALQLDSLWSSGHIILPPRTRSDYMRTPGWKYPEHWKENYWEPVSVLSFLAGVTERITLGTSVTVLPMHNPVEMAKQVAEVDQLSGGRFVFGVGVGWFVEEFDALDRPFHNRGARTNEALEMMKVLWSDGPATFQGRYHRFEQAAFAPKPVQRPHPPIWIGGGSDAALRRAARFGDCWHPVRPTFQRFAEAKAKLARFMEEESRPPDALQLAVKAPIVFQDGPPAEGQFLTEGRPDDIVAALQRFIELDATHFVLDLIPETLPVALDTMERFAQEVRPRLV